MESISVALGYSVNGLPVISIVTSIVALICIIPTWASGMRMTEGRAMLLQRLGAMAIMGPLLWYLFEPVWLFFSPVWEETANLGVLVLLISVTIERYVTFRARMNTIEYIREKRVEDDKSLIARI